MAEQQSPDILLWRHEKLVSFHSSLETGIRLRGNGTLNIIYWCDENGNPPPTWSELAGSVFVTFAPAFGETTPQVTDQVTLQVTPQVARVLEAASSACSFAELQAAAGLKDRVHFLKTHLEPLLLAGWIEPTIPDKPRSSKQKYRLTEKGRQTFHKHEGDRQ